MPVEEAKEGDQRRARSGNAGGEAKKSALKGEREIKAREAKKKKEEGGATVSPIKPMGLPNDAGAVGGHLRQGDGGMGSGGASMAVTNQTWGAQAVEQPGVRGHPGLIGVT